jgi:hypothetical protein
MVLGLLQEDLNSETIPYRLAFLGNRAKESLGHTGSHVPRASLLSAIAQFHKSLTFGWGLMCQTPD